MGTLAFAALVILSFFISTAGLAGDRETADPCANAESTPEMRDCAGRDYKKADAELNKVYGQVMAKLADAGHKAALKNAQQAWIKYRDGQCEFESYLNKGGTLYSVVYTGCLTGITEDKTKDLRETLETLDK